MKCKIWRVSRPDEHGYDEYDSFVCAAKTEKKAREMHPWWPLYKWNGTTWKSTAREDRGWPHPDSLIILELGIANKGIEEGVLCASFNAG